MDIVLLIGLPGSGKTFVALRDYVSQGYALVDDPKSYDEVKAAISLDVPGVVIADPHLCFKNTREAAIRLLSPHTVECVFFENNPERASRNIIHRGDDRGHINLGYFSQGYEIPEGAVPLPIWNSLEVQK